MTSQLNVKPFCVWLTVCQCILHMWLTIQHSFSASCLNWCASNKVQIHPDNNYDRVSTFLWILLELMTMQHNFSISCLGRWSCKNVSVNPATVGDNPPKFQYILSLLKILHQHFFESCLPWWSCKKIQNSLNFLMTVQLSFSESNFRSWPSIQMFSESRICWW